MDNGCFYEFSNSLAMVLSFGVARQMGASVIEKAISYSPYFQHIEKGESPIMVESDLISSLFPEFGGPLDDVPLYSQCAWAGEAYLRIQKETGLTFEAIFLYLPLKETYRLYSLYHEMDFSQIVDHFRSLYSKASALQILLNVYKYSLKYVRERTMLSYDTLNSIKRRRRDVSKIAVSSAVALADLFHVRVETLAEIKAKRE